MFAAFAKFRTIDRTRQRTIWPRRLATRPMGLVHSTACERAPRAPCADSELACGGARQLAPYRDQSIGTTRNGFPIEAGDEFPGRD